MRIAKEIRTSIIDNLIRVGNCFVFNGRACDFANKVMPEEIDFDDIERHYDCYNDWNINRLFFSEMHLLEVSDALFIKFCEEYLNPIYNRKERVEKDDGDWIIVDRTLQCERIINNELGRVDLEVELSISENGLSVHKIKNKVQYPSEDIKNIIFAANAKKPDIVIDNAKMVSANRDMTLNGYDVYRFGGKELYVKNGESDKFVKKMICDFFDRLFIKYGIIQGKDSIH